MRLLVFESDGVFLREGDSKFVVDGRRLSGATAAFVTHAHSDHARLPKNPECDVYAAPETLKMLGWEEKHRVKAFGKRLSLDGFSINFHNAGHIHGSKQVHFANDLDLVVTGDVKLSDDLVVKGATPVASDVLVIESTFGSPEFVFPKREDVYEDMKNWVKANWEAGASVILAGYATGKAQELTAFCNEYLGTPPIVHPKVFRVNKACSDSGARLGEYLSAAGPEAREAARGESVFILPPSMVNMDSISTLSFEFNRRFVAGFATGWASTSFSPRTYSKNFPLSSHADFNELLEIVRQSGAKKVFTYHGFSRELASHLRKRLGVNAVPLTGKKQSSLADFCAMA
ncbi:MAG TPA: MBL fold metallo-hydrolase RNA specificity domain-containing protein [archaeon]|nr:MBL fold metallo-hydrolase RNA specificity domain-containing protein [archaeon]